MGFLGVYRVFKGSNRVFRGLVNPCWGDLWAS